VVAEGTMRFADAYPNAPVAGAFSLAEERPSSWRPEQLYREGMFHGPSFQAVKTVERFGRDGALARVAILPRDGLFRSRPSPPFLTDPVLLDAAGQVLAYWVKERFGLYVDVFPYRLEELALFAPLGEPGGEVECRVRAEALGDTRTAIERYTEFVALWKHADSDRPELATARRFLSVAKLEARRARRAVSG
jgi:hypothetical protein